MDVTLCVKDSIQATAIPGASVMVNGQVEGLTDSGGYYDLRNFDEADTVQVGMNGYRSFRTAGGLLGDTETISLSPAGSSIPSNIVSDPINDSIIIPALVFGGLVLAGKGTGSISGIKKKNIGLILGIGAAGLAAVYLMNKKPAAALPSSTYVPPIAASNALTAPNNAFSSLSSLSSALKSITNIFGGSSASVPPVSSPGAFVPATVDTSSDYYVDPAANIPTVDPGGAMQLQFADASVSGIDMTGATPWVIGGAAILLLMGSKKKKLSGVSDYILPVGLLVGGYLIYKQLSTGGGADQNKAGIDATTSAGITASLKNAAASGDSATISASQAAGLAADIYNQIGTQYFGSPNQDAIVADVMTARSLTDYLLIAQAFGTKQAGGMACSVFGNFITSTCSTYNLDSFLTNNLDASHLATINTYFTNQGINYSL